MTPFGGPPARDGRGIHGPSRAAAARPEVWVADDPRDSVPTAAEVCNVLYGGFHNSTESRRLAGELAAAWPPLRHHTYAGRALVRRMVQHLIAAGVEQFLDIGGGIAQHGATHEIIADTITDPSARPLPGLTPAGGPAQRARVVCADLDPIATDVNRRHLEDLAWATAVVGDLRRPHSILDDPVVNTTLNLDRPVGVLLLGVLHHLPPDADLVQILRTTADALTPGSYLAVSLLTIDPDPAGAAAQRHAAALYTRTPTPLHLRPARNITDLLQHPQLPDLHLVDPGVVPAHHWQPDPDDEPGFPAPHLLAALARIGPAAPSDTAGSRPGPPC
ncbi:SAM-dependent methyltransferase [Dactylosporangium salmoneum]|uniref:SAM-dependent methyltransferase n=1 Tax=Dactylosporangium salmoneum TaxID=53361 RepID=A0ABN3G114_9ACTN